jgi:hypothetical protein
MLPEARSAKQRLCNVTLHVCAAPARSRRRQLYQSCFSAFSRAAAAAAAAAPAALRGHHSSNA